MEVVYTSCSVEDIPGSGLDLPKKSITAWVVAEAKGKSRKEKRPFETFTHYLLELADWLGE